MKKFKPTNKSLKKSLFKGLFNDNDTVKINEPKLVSKKPVNSFFNQSHSSNTSTRRNLNAETKHFESESGVYEEINLEAYGISSKQSKHKPQNYFSGSLESDETEDDYDSKKIAGPLGLKPFSNNQLPSISSMPISNLDLSQKAFTNETYKKSLNEKKLTKNKLEAIKTEIHTENSSVSYEVLTKIKAKNEINKPELLYEEIDTLAIFDKDITNKKTKIPSINKELKSFPEDSNSHKNIADLNMKQNDNILKEESEKNAVSQSQPNNSKKSSISSEEENHKVFEPSHISKHRPNSSIRKSESFNFGGGNSMGTRFQSNLLMTSQINETKNRPTEKKTNFEDKNQKMVIF